MTIPLERIAHARSGDKGDISNVGVIAKQERWYPILLREVTEARVQQHFCELVAGSIVRYELPNLWALNFVMTEALDGGGTISLRTDAQGKTHAAAMLSLPIEVTADELDS